MYHGNNVGHPLYPRIAGQTLTYIMTSRSTSLELKSQLTIILTKKTQREGKFPIQEREKTQKKKREFPIQEREKTQNINKIPNERVGESKKKKRRRKENFRSRIGRKQKKHAERSLDQTISEQYRIVTK